MLYTLKCGSVVATAQTLGGELISYKKDGKEYLWTGDEKYWNGHAPFLFPFVSSLKDGKVEIDGKMYYSKPKHGFVRTTELNVIEKTENKIVFEMCYNKYDKFG